MRLTRLEAFVAIASDHAALFVVLSGLLAAAVYWMQQRYVRDLHPPILQLETARTIQNARSILQSWGAEHGLEGGTLKAKLALLLRWPLAIFTSVFFAGVFWWLGDKAASWNLAFAKWTACSGAVAVTVAGLINCLEMAVLYLTLVRGASRRRVFATSCLANMKFTAIAVAVLALVTLAGACHVYAVAWLLH